MKSRKSCSERRWRRRNAAFTLKAEPNTVYFRGIYGRFVGRTLDVPRRLKAYVNTPVFGDSTETDLGVSAYFGVAYTEVYGAVRANHLASLHLEVDQGSACLALRPAGWLDLAAEMGARVAVNGLSANSTKLLYIFLTSDEPFQQNKRLYLESAM